MRKTLLKYAGILALIIGLVGFGISGFGHGDENDNDYHHRGGWHHGGGYHHGYYDRAKRNNRGDWHRYGRHHRNGAGYGPCWGDYEEGRKDKKEKK